MSLQSLSQNTESIRGLEALAYNITAGKGLKKVLETNLGPRGTLKMLINPSNDIKITKDGNVLLKEMQIQHPTAALIAKSAGSQDTICGDGTTSAVLLIGELLHQCERYLVDGVHPRILGDGFDLAKEKTIQLLEEVKLSPDVDDHDFLCSVARTSLSTKIHPKLAEYLTPIVVDAVKTIKKDDEPIDLHMIEILSMQHQSDVDTRLIKGLVLDHGARDSNMPNSLSNCHILTCNISLEAEKPTGTTTIYYKNAEEREAMLAMERKFVEDRVRKIIELKREVCDTPEKSFVVINQRGIDPGSLNMLANEGIIALRRAKRRNMERCTRACGGIAVNSVQDLHPDILGYAETVYQHTLNEERYTFIEGVENPISCTILMKGPNKHTIIQIKDSLRDGIRAVKNAIEDKSVLPGAGAFELYAHNELMKFKNTLTGRVKFGVQAFADALLVIPKTLALNSGFDVMDTLLVLQDQIQEGHMVGLDIQSGLPIDPTINGIYDGYRVKRNLIMNSSTLSSKLLLVDEVIAALSQ